MGKGGVTGQPETKKKKNSTSKKKSEKDSFVFIQPFVYSFGRIAEKTVKISELYPEFEILEDWNPITKQKSLSFLSHLEKFKVIKDKKEWSNIFDSMTNDELDTVSKDLELFDKLHYKRSFIENGWLYVYNKTLKTSYEYHVVSRNSFQKIAWPKETQESKDIRTEKEGSPTNYIIIPKKEHDVHEVQIAYSEVQWSWKRYTEIIGSENEREERMQLFTIGKSVVTNEENGIFASQDLTKKYFYLSENENVIDNCQKNLIRKGAKKDCIAVAICLNDPIGIATQLSIYAQNVHKKEFDFINRGEFGFGRGLKVSGLIDILIKIDKSYDNDKFIRKRERNSFKARLLLYLYRKVGFGRSLDDWSLANKDEFLKTYKDYEGSDINLKKKSLVFYQKTLGLNYINKSRYFESEIKNPNDGSLWSIIENLMNPDLGKDNFDILDHIFHKFSSFLDEIADINNPAWKRLDSLLKKNHGVTLVIEHTNDLKQINRFFEKYSSIKGFASKGSLKLIGIQRVDGRVILGSIKDLKPKDLKSFGTLVGIFSLYNISQILPKLGEDSWEYANLIDQVATITDVLLTLASNRLGNTLANIALQTVLRNICMLLGFIAGIAGGIFTYHQATQMDDTGDTDSQFLYYSAAATSFGSGVMMGFAFLSVLTGGAFIPFVGAGLLLGITAAGTTVGAELAKNDKFENWLNLGFWGRNCYGYNGEVMKPSLDGYVLDDSYNENMQYKDIPNLVLYTRRIYDIPSERYAVEWVANEKYEKTWFYRAINDYNYSIKKDFASLSGTYDKVSIEVDLPLSFNERKDEINLIWKYKVGENYKKINKVYKEIIYKEPEPEIPIIEDGIIHEVKKKKPLIVNGKEVKFKKPIAVFWIETWPQLRNNMELHFNYIKDYKTRNRFSIEKKFKKNI